MLFKRRSSGILFLTAAVFSVQPIGAAAEPQTQPAAAAENTARPRLAAKPQGAVPAQSSRIPISEQVLAAFSGYRNAVLASDGKKAALFVTKHIFDYFSRVREWALYAPKEKLQALPFTDQVTILRLRASINSKKLAKMSGKSLFILSVEQNWLEKEYLQKVELAEVPVEESAQTVMLPQTINGRKIPGLIHFEKENKRWKLNAYSLLIGSSFVFEHSLKEVKENKITLIESAMSSILAKDFDQAWWQPPEKKPAGKELGEFELESILPQQIPISRHQQN